MFAREFRGEAVGINKKELISETDSMEYFNLVKPKYTFKDIVLNPSIQEQLEDFLAFYSNRSLLFGKWGLQKRYNDRKNLCLNLYGESGTGKTMVAHAIADSLGKKLLQVNYADIESKYVGETSKNLQKLFCFGREKEAIILFDEADALLSRRVTDMRNATDVSVNQTRSVLLTLLDNYNNIIIFTTNFISNYDTAFMRRIQYHIRFLLPTLEQRVELWKFYLEIDLPNKVNVMDMAEKYEGVTGADIATAVFQATVSTARKKASLLIQSDLEKAIEKIIESKQENTVPIKIAKREVSEEYVKEQLGGKM